MKHKFGNFARNESGAMTAMGLFVLVATIMGAMPESW